MSPTPRPPSRRSNGLCDLPRRAPIAGIVTNPIQKKTLQDAGFRHPGHTEFLAELAGGVDVAMMLACPQLRVVPVTIHLSLADAVKALDGEAIVRAGRIAAHGPAAICSASSNRVWRWRPSTRMPASRAPWATRSDASSCRRSRRCGGKVSTAHGPAPADTLFHAAARPAYDVALCMYHDQALIPIKTIDFAGGVNVTLGLPFVRTSPDHGTALDIAGTGRADPTSLIAAIDMADDMARRRRH